MLIFLTQSVSAWTIQKSENYTKNQVDANGDSIGQANAKVVMIIGGNDNESHTIEFGFFIIGNGVVDEIQIISVNANVYRNGSKIEQIALSPAGIITYANEFSADIYYNSNITLTGTMKAKFEIDGVEKTITYNLKFFYDAPAPPLPSIPSYNISIMILVFPIVALILIKIKRNKGLIKIINS